MTAVVQALGRLEAAPVGVSFDACYQAHAPRVYRWGLRFGAGSRSFAEDLTHDVFVRLLEELPRLDAPDDVGGWLYRVTANLALSRLKRERSFLARFERLFGAQAEVGPDRSLELRQDARRALQALEALPAKERVALSMKLLDGKSQREIADALSMSEGYVSKLVTRAWGRLRAAGWEVSDVEA